MNRMAASQRSHTIWLLAIWNFVNVAFLSLLYIQFYRNHVSLAEVFFAEALGAALVVAFIFVRRKVNTKGDMLLGFAMIGLSIAVLLLPWSRAYFYAHVILRSLGSITFYIPYNILFFNKTADDYRARSMNQYWSVGITAGIVGPLIGAAIFTHFGLTYFLLVALAFMVFGMVLMSRLANRHIVYTRAALLGQIKRLRTITMVDGSLHRLPIIVSIFALLFVSNEYDYGMYISLVALAALAVSTLVARASDKTMKRMRYITPLMVAGAIATMLFSVAHTAIIFFALAVVIKIVSVIADPLRSTIILDRHAAEDPIIWLSREFYINMGRAVLLGGAALCVYLGSTRVVFVFLALPYLLFPLLVRRKKIYTSLVATEIVTD